MRYVWVDGKGYEYTFLEEITTYSPYEVNSTGMILIVV